MHAMILMFATVVLAFWPARIEAQCTQCKGDFDNNGHVTVDELVTAVNNSLNGCPAPSPRFVDNGDGTVTDNKTGLTWEKKSNDGSLNDQATQYTWDDAVSVFVAGLNAGTGFAGHTDWRLPSVTELQSLLDYGRLSPAVDPAFNTACAADCTVTTCSCTQFNTDFEGYWSATAYPDPDLPGFAWNLDFNFGQVNGADQSLAVYFARAVRGGG